MEVKAKYKINDNYVVGDDKKIYRLPYVVNLKHYELKELKPQRKNTGYYFYGKFVLKKNIKYVEIEPYILIKEQQETPF